MSNTGIELIKFDGSRNNNFTAVRILFAWLVLYGHSFAIQNSAGIKDPFNLILMGSTWVGEISVYGFFAISGFLVTASFMKRGVVDYAISRGLRIFPALIICVLVTMFILGPIFTNLASGFYFSEQGTYDYLVNLVPFIGVEYNLPGVFEGNERTAVNGSLWSLIVEIRCYILLVIAGVFGLLRSKTIANLSVLAIFLFGFSSILNFHFLARGSL